jgi:hypothetical protein
VVVIISSEVIACYRATTSSSWQSFPHKVLILHEASHNQSNQFNSSSTTPHAIFPLLLSPIEGHEQQPAAVLPNPPIPTEVL